MVDHQRQRQQSRLSNPCEAQACLPSGREESDQPRAVPVVDDTVGADLYVTLPCEGYIQGATGAANALEQAEAKIRETLLAFAYEKQA